MYLAAVREHGASAVAMAKALHEHLPGGGFDAAWLLLGTNARLGLFDPNPTTEETPDHD